MVVIASESKFVEVLGAAFNIVNMDIQIGQLVRLRLSTVKEHKVTLVRAIYNLVPVALGYINGRYKLEIDLKRRFYYPKKYK